MKKYHDSLVNRSTIYKEQILLETKISKHYLQLFSIIKVLNYHLEWLIKLYHEIYNIWERKSIIYNTKFIIYIISSFIAGHFLANIDIFAHGKLDFFSASNYKIANKN